MPFVINRKLILIEMLVFGEIGSAIEFDPSRIRFPAVPDYKMADTWEVTLAWQLTVSGKCRISRRDLWVVPQKFQNRQHPLLAEETAFAQKPRAVWILEPIHGITQQSCVSCVQNRIFVIAFARRRAIGKQLVEIRIPNIPKQWEVMSRIDAFSSPLKFGQ